MFWRWVGVSHSWFVAVQHHSFPLNAKLYFAEPLQALLSMKVWFGYGAAKKDVSSTWDYQNGPCLNSSISFKACPRLLKRKEYISIGTRKIARNSYLSRFRENRQTITENSLLQSIYFICRGAEFQFERFVISYLSACNHESMMHVILCAKKTWLTSICENRADFWDTSSWSASIWSLCASNALFSTKIGCSAYMFGRMQMHISM